MVDRREERIALFMDFENLAIGAREALGGAFDMKPIADALSDRGRVVLRRAYADWNLFEEFRRMLSEHHVEMIEIPQRLGAARKNAADIKMAVDAVELAIDRPYVSTLVIATGDSDFTPLVYKLRELDRRVIGIGVRASTSKLLPPACDEFLFYESLEGVEPSRSRRRPRTRAAAPEVEAVAEPVAEAVAEQPADLAEVVTQALAGLQRSGDGVVLGSQLKRAILRRDPTFSEADHGFRAFRELLRSLEERGAIELTEGPARGDPEVTFPHRGGGDGAFGLLAQVVGGAKGGSMAMSGIKDAMRKVDPEFNERAFGYGGFLQYSRAAAAAGVIDLEWSDDADDYIVSPAS